MTHQKQLVVIPFFAALAIAVVTRLLFPFDGLYGQDAFAYFNYARALGPHLRSGAPLPQLSWPIGYPVAVAFVLPIFGGRPVAGQIVSTLACAWAAGATSLVVRDRGQPLDRSPGSFAGALAAGLSVALSGGVLRYSQTVMADGLSLGAAATAVWCAVRFVKGGRGSWLIAVACAWAFGTATRWLVGVLAVPLALFLAMEWRSGSVPRFAGKRVWRWALAAALAALAILLPQLAIARAVPSSLEKHEWLLTWSPKNAVLRDFHTPEGHTVYRLPVALFYVIRAVWHDYFFPVTGLVAAIGGWALVRGRRWSDTVLLLGWPAAAWLFLCGIPYENPRFLLPTLSAVGVLVGMGFGRLRATVFARSPRVLVFLLSASTVAGLFFGGREHARQVARKNADRDLVNWAAARVPAGATLLMAGGALMFEEYGSLRVRETFSMSADELDALVSKPEPFFLLERPTEINAQWAGLQPQRHFEALARHPGLVEVDRRPPDVLFRIMSVGASAP
jgi:hypothetical protein